MRRSSDRMRKGGETLMVGLRSHSSEPIGDLLFGLEAQAHCFVCDIARHRCASAEENSPSLWAAFDEAEVRVGSRTQTLERIVGPRNFTEHRFLELMSCATQASEVDAVFSAEAIVNNRPRNS